MVGNTLIVKIGGKILENSENLESTLNQLKKVLFDYNIFQNLLIIPGGGILANFIREIDNKLDIGNDLAHWMAILAMDYNGKKLSEKYADIKYINNFNELQNLLSKTRQLIIFGPYKFLNSKDPLPHSWEVTSDSIALYFASELKLTECFLIKDIDGIYIKGQKDAIQELSVKDYLNLKKENKLIHLTTDNDLKQSTPIDSHLLTLIENYRIPSILLNGTKRTSRILDYFNPSAKRKKIYTVINCD